MTAPATPVPATPGPVTPAPAPGTPSAAVPGNGAATVPGTPAATVPGGGAATVEALVAAELDRPVPPEARALAEAILARHGDAVAAILFYGSCLRGGDASGLLDLYVLVDRARDWHRSRFRAALMALLPPDVEHWRVAHAGGVSRAKVAVMTRRGFARRVREGSLDTSLWARFSQPAALLHARDAGARDWAVAALSEAVRTAAAWAARLSPGVEGQGVGNQGVPARGAAARDAGAREGADGTGTAAAHWTALFRATYRAELRPERPGRAAEVVAADPARYEALLRAAWNRPHGPLLPPVPARRAWWPRRALGKGRNLLRLLKAAFTFAGGADYVAWKVGRHSGQPLVLTEWQRRHPVLAAPGLLWRLRRCSAGAARFRPAAPDRTARHRPARRHRRRNGSGPGPRTRLRTRIPRHRPCRSVSEWESPCRSRRGSAPTS